MLKLLSLINLMSLLVIPISSTSFGWGFSKNEIHEQPEIGIYKEEIEGTNSFYVGDNNKKEVYITFDAGYDNGNLVKILDILDEKKVKGAFFITGDFLTRFSDLVVEINKRGHIIGNHTWSHKNITTLSSNQIKEELKKVEDEYYSLTGDHINSYFRPPAGVFNKQSLNTVKDLGYSTIFWSIAYKDWEIDNQKQVESAVDSVIDNLHNGAIILLHTVSKANVDALPIIIDKIKENGYKIKSLDEIFYNADNFIDL